MADETLLPLVKEADGQRQVKIGGEKYLLSVSSGTSGLVYCSLQSMDVFYNKIVTGQWGIIVLLIICAILTALFIMVISRRMTAKVKKMNQLLDSQEETNYNLSSIESGIQMLVAANEQKEKENLQLKKTRFIRNSRISMICCARPAALSLKQNRKKAWIVPESWKRPQNTWRRISQSRSLP